MSRYGWANPRCYPTSTLVPKVRYGAAKQIMLVHNVVDARALWNRGRLNVQAEWLCGDGAGDVVLFADVDSGGSRCVRCRTIEAGCIGVYRCFDKSERLLYIGSSQNTSVRLSQHRGLAPWWPDVNRVEVEEYGDVLSARRAEARAIATERPMHNKRGVMQFHEAGGAA